jgi:hypothetical protein
MGLSVLSGVPGDTGVFDLWVQSCPLEYANSDAPAKRDMPGTPILGLPAGQRRYAQIIALRDDAVAAHPTARMAAITNRP